MSDAELDIRLATRDDVVGILALQDANQPEHGGRLSARLAREWIEAALSDAAVIVARSDGQIVGYLVASSVEAQSFIPIVQALLKVYTSAPGAYIYGPICVAESERGRGLAGALHQAAHEHLRRRDGFTFIRSDNAPSLRAHAKMGMHFAVEFTHGGVRYTVMTYDEATIPKAGHRWLVD